MSVSSYIAKHISASGGTSSRQTPAVAVASAGLALSFVVMLLAIAVTDGFKRQISDKISGFESQIRITPFQSSTDTNEAEMIWSDELLNRIRDAVLPYSDNGNPDVARASIASGLLKTANEFAGLAIKAYGPEASMDFERNMLIEGTMPGPNSQNEIAISIATAKNLNLSVGDKVNAYFIESNGVRPRRFKVSGIFRSDFSEFDNLMAFGSERTIRSLRRASEVQADAVEIRCLDPQQINDAALALQQTLNKAFASGLTPKLLTAIPITVRAATYYNWLDMLDTNITVILTLMGCVSAFMIIACVLILVLKRVRMVGILKAIGATNKQIERIFIYLSLRVIISGLIVGNIVALGLIALQHYLHIVPLNPENYYLSYVPVHLTLTQWIVLNLSAALLAVAVAILPAMLVRRLSASRTMRWE